MRTCTNITAEQRNPVRAKTPQLFIQVGKVTVDWQPPVQRLGLPACITHNKTQGGEVRVFFALTLLRYTSTTGGVGTTYKLICFCVRNIIIL